MPDHLLVLRCRRGMPVDVIYNGPGELPWEAAGAIQKNGKRPISLARLGVLDKAVPDSARLPFFRASPI